MKAKKPLMVAIGLMLLGAFGCSGQIQTGKSDDIKLLTRQALTQDGKKRDFFVYTPRVANGEQSKLPVVIVLHGGGSDAENAVRMTGFISLARKQHFMVVFPNGASRRKRGPKTWNAGHCCAYAMKRKSDDVDFISDIIDAILANYPADPGRIFVTGMSNGGMMTHRIGRELSDKVAAIATVVGGLFGDEKAPANPVPALIINGALDTTVPPAGGLLGGRASGSGDGTSFKPAEFQAKFWAAANGCSQVPSKKTDAPSVTLFDYNCPANQDVKYYLVMDNGHAWPGGDKGSRRGDEPSSALDATRVIWEFFQQNSRP